jgi:hypothetical protein
MLRLRGQFYQRESREKGGVTMSAAARAEMPVGTRQFLRVRCETNSGGRECRIMDLSSAGAFIESFVPPVTGSHVNVRFRLPGGETIRTNGVVKYHQFKIGFGLEFTDLSSTDKGLISSFLNSRP